MNRCLLDKLEMLKNLLPECELEDSPSCLQETQVSILSKFTLEKLCKNVWPAFAVIGGKNTAYIQTLK